MNDLDFIRKEIKLILIEEYKLTNEEKEKYLVNENYALFKQSFIDPFVDVFKVAWIGMKRVLTAANRVFLSLITFRAKRQQEIRREFRAKDQKLAAEMKSIADKAVDAAGPGFSAAKFAFSPGMWLADAALENASWSETRDWLTETGFNEWPVVGNVIDADPQTFWAEMDEYGKMVFDQTLKSGLIAGATVSVGTELAKLFLGENTLLEQKEEEKEDETTSLDDLSGKQLAAFTKELFKRTGIIAAIEKWRAGWLKERRDFFEELTGDVIPLGNFIKSFTEISSYNDLEELASKYQIKEINLGEIKSEFEKQVNDYLSSEEKVKEFLSKAVETKQVSKEKSEELIISYGSGKTDEIEKLISKVIWMGSKDEIVSKMIEETDKIKKEVEEAYKEYSFEEDKSDVSSTSDGAEYISALDEKMKEFRDAFTF